MKKIPNDYVEMVRKSVMKMYTEEDKKKLGIAPCKKSIVYKQNVWKLLRYRNNTVKDPVPVLVIPSLINRNYIMDLLKEHSLIESLIKSGKDVFIIDWGNPDSSIGHIGIKEYISKFVKRAVRKVKKITKSNCIDMLGQCIGGFMSAVYCSHPEFKKDIRKLVLLTTPLHFENSGLLYEMTDRKHFDIEKILSGHGPVIPHEFFHSIFPFLCIKQTLGKYKTLLEQFELPNFAQIWQSLDLWANDNVPFSKEAFRELIVELYQKDSFYNGKFQIDGFNVGIKDLNIPTLCVAARDDHVFSQSATDAVKLSKAYKTKKLSYHIIPAGHVTLIAAHPVRFDTFKLISEYLTKEN